MKTSVETYTSYELKIPADELKALIDALSELLYNENLGAVTLQFGGEGSDKVALKFIHEDREQALLDAIEDEDETDFEEDEGYLTQDAWDEILTALVEDPADVSDRYAGQV